MGELEETPEIPFTRALMCGWLNDPEWLIEFESSVRRFHSVGRELAKNYALPGYPLPMQAGNLFTAYAILELWIKRAFSDLPKRLADKPIFGVEEKILRAYIWAGALIARSEFRRITPGQNPASLPDRSWIPTQDELESWQGILDLLAHFDFQGSLSGNGEPAIRPRWDSDKLTLVYGDTVCRHYKRRNAPNQFKVLNAFQAANWARSVGSPFGFLDRTLSETIDDMNSSLTNDSPIRFGVEERKPIWFLRNAPASSG
jgi:hypothetical protein